MLWPRMWTGSAGEPSVDERLELGGAVGDAAGRMDAGH